MSEPQSWVDWFLSTPRGSIFVKIDEEYLANTFNFYGIRQKVPNFKICLELIRGPMIPKERRPPEWPEEIDDYGMCLYGLLHARYLLTAAGQRRALEKYRKGEFPKCPRSFCDGVPGIPVGMSDEIGESNVKVYCPNCQDIYSVSDKRFTSMDGAFFGPSWCHLFVKRFPEIVPQEPPRKYVPRIFGFKVIPPDSYVPE